ncbi:hypothetical protein ACH5RR_006509 [Cinchona calisaya]|uniref:Uncharacterized protein n=1 Tax=Cinchona calisaya TaxID=153742 RepID=A0ABD3AP69_9GENT
MPGSQEKALLLYPSLEVVGARLVIKFELDKTKLSNKYAPVCYPMMREMPLISIDTEVNELSAKESALPLSLCDEIDKVNRRFLRGGSDNKSKMSLVKWSIVTSPKSDDGLDLRSMSIAN